MTQCSTQIKAIPLTSVPVGSARRLIRSSANGYTFAYAPSIIKVGSMWHAYYCSNGTSSVAWDYIRHSTSTDLVTWSTPDAILIPSDSVNERSCCDPSIVKFNAGDGEFYYLFYSGNKFNVQTVNFVARSASPFGPFEKRTVDGAWRVNAPNPKITHYPFKSALENSGIYGLGQPAVVVRGNLLYMWFMDNTERVDNATMIYLTTSTDAVTWQRPIPTAVVSNSIDVKFDAAAGTFIMFSGEDHHGSQPKMMSRVSDDGVHWSAPTVLFDMPAYSHNIGVSGGERGELQQDKMLYAYGAPVDLVNNSSWGAWDLYGNIFESSAPPYLAPVYKRAASAVATEAISGLTAVNVTDGNPNTFYSSQYFTSKNVDRPIYLAGWFADGKVTISKVVLKARVSNGVVMGFPEKCNIHVTAPDNSTWISLGAYSTQPNVNGEAIIDIGSRECYGILISPTIVGADSYGNHFFQLAEIGAFV